MSDAQRAAACRGVSPQWTELVERIQRGDSGAMEELYAIFSTGVRFQLCRQLGPQDLDDAVHDVFLIIAEAIRAGAVREPDRLMGFVQTVVKRQAAAHIASAVKVRRREIGLDPAMPLTDREPDPERRLLALENTDLALRVLNGIPPRDREVLVRFYLREQAAPDICREMSLSATQFRLIKSRAKARFGDLGKSRLARKTGFSPA